MEPIYTLLWTEDCPKLPAKRNVPKCGVGMKKAEALVRVSAFLQGAILIADCWIRPGGR